MNTPKVPPLTPSELEVRRAMRVLLEGTCGVDVHKVAKATGLDWRNVRGFMLDDRGTRQESVDAIGWYVWRKLNAHLLIGPEDLLVEEEDSERDRLVTR